MSLSFLQTIKVEDGPKRKGGGLRKDWNPTLPLAIRVWKDGSVLPSQGLLERFDLEYRPKPPEDKELAKAYVYGNGFDVFSSKDSKQFTSEVPLVWISPAAKNLLKVNLFASTGYNEDGTSTSSVMDQGAVTYGKNTLLPMLKDVYGVEPNEAGFIDLVFLGAPPVISEGMEAPDEATIQQYVEDAAQPFLLPDGKVVGYIPKQVSRGEAIGEATYQRRQKPQVYILYPYVLLHPEDAAADKAMADMVKKHGHATVKE